MTANVVTDVATIVTTAVILPVLFALSRADDDQQHRLPAPSKEDAMPAISDDERARRRLWGRVEEVSGDAITDLQRAVSDLPDGHEKGLIVSYVREAERALNEATEVAIRVCHNPDLRLP